MWPDWKAEHVELRRPTWGDALPFVLVGVIGLATLVVPSERDLGISLWLMLAVFALTLAVLGYGIRQPTWGWPRVAAPLLAFAVIACARDVGGGSDSGLGTLVILPLLWLAVTGRPRDLLYGALATVAVFGLPILLIGAPDYPAEDWRRTVVWVAFALLLAPGIQAMVQELAQGSRALAGEEAQWRALADRLPDVTVLVVDDELRLRRVAGAGAERHEMRGKQGRGLHEITTPANLATLTRLLRAAFAGHEGSTELTATADGADLLVTVSPLPPDEDGKRALIVARDVSTDRQRERELIRAHERTERLFADAPQGVMVLSPDGRIVRTNNALRTMIGVGPGQLEGQHYSDLADVDDRSLEEHFTGVLAEDTVGPVRTDAVLRDVRDESLNVALSSLVLHETDAAEDQVLVNVVDVSERRRYEERLAHLADHDALTGLANRRRFEAELQRHVEHCRRYGPTGALLMLDLDHFKQVNDTLGHHAGDQLIASTAALLRRNVRSTDVVARLGGDEFAVLLTDGDQQAAAQVAGGIVERVREFTATLDGVRRRVTTSIGVVTFVAAGEHALDIMALADLTMYDAKDAGRDRYALLEEGAMQPPRTGARLQWQARIEEALANDGFELLLQPILDLHTDTIGGAEVLLRLRDGEELISPSRFIYVAERVGLMPEIDRWVLRHSFPLLAELRELAPGFQLEVNLSGHSIGRPEIEQAVTEGLARHDIDPGALILEITETAAVADVALAREFAERMTALGCRFALDDFGAGFGSFYYLKHLLFDFVKIDGEFVAGSHRTVVDRTIVRSIVGIARDLGKKTVAEFVSDPAILEVVREEGVDQAQGYLIGAPVPWQEFVATFLGQPATSDASGTGSVHR